MSRARKENYRLAPNELHALLDKIQEDYKQNKAFAVDEGFVEVKNSQHSLNQQVNYFSVQPSDHNDKRQFIVFRINKDAASLDNENQLPYVGEVLRNFLKENKYKNAMLLIPLRQCRDFGKVNFLKKARRQHIILLEVDLSARTIVAHDSQSKTRYRFYPDKLKDIAKELGFRYDSARDYRAYNTQKNETLCGWFVRHYIIDILEKGNSQHLDKIVLRESDYANKEEYLKKCIPNWVSQSEEHQGDHEISEDEDHWNRLDGV